jgi:hypothetical protein
MFIQFNDKVQHIIKCELIKDICKSYEKEAAIGIQFIDDDSKFIFYQTKQERNEDYDRIKRELSNVEE